MTYISGVSADSRQLIVDKHNELRGSLLAANMQKMVGVHNSKHYVSPKNVNEYIWYDRQVWDDELAALAERWADNCEYKHDLRRAIPGRFSVGKRVHRVPD